MQTAYGHLSYCTNIHAGESWEKHFGQLQEFVPEIKTKVSPNRSFGIGLRLSNEASMGILKNDQLKAFRNWLNAQDCYVFTMNGFPYGGFHNTVVKDQVHAPDWTTQERVDYTIRLAEILAELLPEVVDGSISTSPLSYRLWHQPAQYEAVTRKATESICLVVEKLLRIRQGRNKLIHIDIEPEPDGLLETGEEFFSWYQNYLLPIGMAHLQKHAGLNAGQAEQALKDHVQLCYDVCHFAIGFEDPEQVLAEAAKLGIGIGKIQISAALKARMDTPARPEVIAAFRRFNETTYLHQVIARKTSGALERFADLPQALERSADPSVVEWRAHFHVPLFIEDYGVLASTQEEIRKLLALQQSEPFSAHMEVETYTWEVLPPELKLPLSQSIIRELEWVMNLLNVPAKAEPVNP